MDVRPRRVAGVRYELETLAAIMQLPDGVKIEQIFPCDSAQDFLDGKIKVLLSGDIFPERQDGVATQEVTLLYRQITGEFGRTVQLERIEAAGHERVFWQNPNL
jgi:hypothetical protein